MGLNVRSISVREAAGCDSLFPVAMSSLLCDAVAAIRYEDLPKLRDRHESDHANFDGKIEDTIRSMRPDLLLHANHPVCEGLRFNNDLVLETADELVCLEIEKGSLARFEFDILKMQAAASQWLTKRPEAKVYGAFIVPADKVVANHISGNARESSYKYLKRLARLIARIDPLILSDILIIGYSTSLTGEQTPPRQSKGATEQHGEVASKRHARKGPTITKVVLGCLAKNEHMEVKYIYDAIVEAGFKDTKFKKTHLAWYKCQIRKGKFVLPNGKQLSPSIHKTKMDDEEGRPER